MMNSTKRKKNISICFLITTSSILFLFYLLPIVGQTDVSVEENRTLQHVPKFTFASFFDGTYQKKMEQSISDQLIFSAQIKYGVRQVLNTLTSTTANVANFQFREREVEVVKEPIEKTIEREINELLGIQTETPVEILSKKSTKKNASSKKQNVQEIEKPTYIYQEVVANKFYKLDDSGYIVEKAHSPEEYKFDIYNPEMLAAVTFPKYLFFIETSECVDFNDLNPHSAYEYVKTQFSMTDYTLLTFNSFEEYKKYFYQTDHHWNYYGSYVGYSKIMQMIEGEDVQLLKPTGIFSYNVIYNGSRARDYLLRCSTEKFKVFLFDLPKYTTYVDDVEMEYGYRSWYLSADDCPHKVYSNHYGMYYGDDRAKVIFDYNAPEKENILIMATSFSNAINELIASHYNETHIFDYRFYPKKYGPINAQKYMEEHNISKLLIIGDISSLGVRGRK